MELNTPEFKKGLTELLAANPEILQPVIEEIMEDFVLGKLMEQCENDSIADFGEVMAFLDAHRIKE